MDTRDSKYLLPYSIDEIYKMETTGKNTTLIKEHNVGEKFNLSTFDSPAIFIRKFSLPKGKDEIVNV